MPPSRHTTWRMSAFLGSGFFFRAGWATRGPFSFFSSVCLLDGPDCSLARFLFASFGSHRTGGQLESARNLVAGQREEKPKVQRSLTLHNRRCTVDRAFLLGSRGRRLVSESNPKEPNAICLITLFVGSTSSRPKAKIEPKATTQQMGSKKAGATTPRAVFLCLFPEANPGNSTEANMEAHPNHQWRCPGDVCLARRETRTKQATFRGSHEKAGERWLVSSWTHPKSNQEKQTHPFPLEDTGQFSAPAPQFSTPPNPSSQISNVSLVPVTNFTRKNRVTTWNWLPVDAPPFRNPGLCRFPSKYPSLPVSYGFISSTHPWNWSLGNRLVCVAPAPPSALRAAPGAPRRARPGLRRR